MQSDEDSADEDDNDLNRLTGNQLRAQAQLQATTLTPDGLDYISLGDPDIIVSNPVEDIDLMAIPSTSSNVLEVIPAHTITNDKTLSKQLSHKTQLCSKKTQSKPINKKFKKGPKPTRNWEQVDIDKTPEHEWEMPDFINVDRTPTEFFELFFDDQLIELIVQESKKYAMFKGNHTFNVTANEIRVFTGILLLSGYCSVARNRLYWDTGMDTHHPGVAAAMSRNRFEEILRYFHISDNNNLDVTDKYTKIRPLWKHLNAKWLEYFPGDPYISIDESMVRYFGRHGAKQHIQNKPIRFGFKVWSMCTRLGYMIQGEPYQGAATGNTHPHLGCGGSVVMNLVKKLPSDRKYSLFVDNYFTSLPLLEELKGNGHDCTGTIRADRVEKAPLTDFKSFKKLNRGSFEQLTDRKSGTTLVRYHDNSVVTLASNRAGVYPLGSCNRWSQQEKKKFLSNNPYVLDYTIYIWEALID